MKKEMKISVYNIELDFEEHTIKIDNKTYRRDEVEVIKRLYTSTSRVYDGRVGYKVKAGGMYRSHSKPVYKTVTKSFDVLDIKKPDGSTETIRYNAFEQLSVDTVKAWYDGRDYEEFMQEYAEKQKKENKDFLMNTTAYTIIFILSILLCKGNLLVFLILIIWLIMMWKAFKK